MYMKHTQKTYTYNVHVCVYMCGTYVCEGVVYYMYIVCIYMYVHVYDVVHLDLAHIIAVVVELVRDDSQVSEAQSSGNLLGLVGWVCSVPYELMQPGRGEGEREKGGREGERRERGGRGEGEGRERGGRGEGEGRERGRRERGGREGEGRERGRRERGGRGEGERERGGRGEGEGRERGGRGEGEGRGGEEEKGDRGDRGERERERESVL